MVLAHKELPAPASDVATVLIPQDALTAVAHSHVYTFIIRPRLARVASVPVDDGLIPALVDAVGGIPVTLDYSQENEVDGVTPFGNVCDFL